MTKNFQLFLVLIFCLSFSSCSSFGWLKFWENDDEEDALPAILEQINQEVSLKSLWEAKVGKGKPLGRILPSISINRVFHLNSEGTIFAFDNETGSKIWTKKTDDLVSGGVYAGFNKLLYATLDGEIVLLDQEEGVEIWRSQTSSEVLSPPITDGKIVIAQGVDGSVSGIDLKDGQRKWVHQSSVPSLSLRGTASPILRQGFIFTGFANGTVAMIYPDSGAVRLELPVTINEGKSELERIVDIDGKSVVSNNVLISASYQGNITAIDLQQGRPIWQEKISTVKDLIETRSRIIAVDEKDILKAFGLNSGAILWQQSGLRLRGLSSPVNLKGNVVVGDFEGFIHILDGRDGTFLGRKKISKNSISEIVSEGNKLAITDKAGKLFFLSLE